MNDNIPTDITPIASAGKRQNVFILAIRHFPTSLLATAIGIAFLTAPLFYNLFADRGVDSVLLRIILTAVVVCIIPVVFLYVVSLFRAPTIQTKLEATAERELETMAIEMSTLRAKEKKEEEHVQRLEKVLETDINIRKAIERKENERWDVLNDQLRLQKETSQLASEETVTVAKQVKEIKNEAKVALKEYALDGVEARTAKDKIDEDHWETLDMRLQTQEKQNKERDEQQIVRDEEVAKLRADDLLKDQYKALLERHIRNAPAAHEVNQSVADGIAPIPEEWLRQQPEILKDPGLMQQIAELNSR
jgi:hypothetical protein